MITSWGSFSVRACLIILFLIPRVFSLPDIPVLDFLSPKTLMNLPFRFSASAAILEIGNHSRGKVVPNIRLVSLDISLPNLGGKHSLTL